MANCTHVSIAQTLRKSGLFSRVDSLEVYSLPTEERARQFDDLAQFDFILTIEHGEGFGPLSTAVVREAYPGRTFTLPTPFFSGVMPDMAYLVCDGVISRAPGVMGDYHSALILLECQGGLSEEQVVRRYESGTAFERLDVKGIWSDSLNELKTREKETDISISDYIEARSAEGRIGEDFLSFNHPTEGLINHIAGSFVSKAFGGDVVIAPLPAKEHNLYCDAFWPIHPAVSEILGLPARKEVVFKTPDRMGAERFGLREFATRSFRFFNEGRVPMEFELVTPWYLRSRIV